MNNWHIKIKTRAGEIQKSLHNLNDGDTDNKMNEVESGSDVNVGMHKWKGSWTLIVKDKEGNESHMNSNIARHVCVCGRCSDE